MDDMRAFEQRVGAEVNRAMGPSEPVDDLAIFDEITAATRSPKWRFPSLFSAAKFVVAGAIVALFGAFLLAGLLTGVRDQEGVPPAGASPSASPSGSILSRMDLETEEVAPGVFRVLGDGHRRLDEKVDTVAITPEGDVWVLTYSGQGESIRIVRAGEPEVAYQNDDAAGPAGLGLGRLVTGDGGAIGYAQGTYEVPAVLDGREWVAHDGSRYDNCVRFFGSVAADGACFEFEDYSHGLTRQDDGEGSRSPFPLGIRPAFSASSPLDVQLGHPVSEDGIVWFPAFSPTDQGTAFGGLARYDGESWATFPYTEEDGPRISGPLAVTPEGVVWIPTYQDDEGLTMVSWDGEMWRSFGPLAVPQGAADAHVHQDGTITFGVMAVFDGTSLRRLDLPDAVVRGMYGPLTYAPDGSAWVVKGDGLYVISPEALTAIEPVLVEPTEAAEPTEPAPTTVDLLPGVDLDTVELETGVFQVVRDGVRDIGAHSMDVGGFPPTPPDQPEVVTTDGDVWLVFGEAASRLGDPVRYRVDARADLPHEISVTGSSSVDLVPADYAYPATWSPASMSGERHYGHNYAVGPSQTAWERPGARTGRLLRRHTPDETEEFGVADGIPVFRGINPGFGQRTVVAPDGAAWFSLYDQIRHNPVAPSDCGGLVRFDGQVSTYFLQDRGFCVAGLDVDTQGQVWVLGQSHVLADEPREDGSSWNDGPTQLFVITPAALATTE